MEKIKENNSEIVKTNFEDVSSDKKLGGLKTMPFIIANEALEKVASVGLISNMILYLKNEYHITNASGATILFWWNAMSNFTPIFGAFLADSYLGRFYVIALGTFITLIGMLVLWLTAILKEARPHGCKLELGNCIQPTIAQYAFLFSSFVLMSIGAGGIRPCSLAFGADQFDNPKNPNNGRILQSFFNWYYAAVGISVLISVTIIVYIQTQFGWVVGFGVPAGLMFLNKACIIRNPNNGTSTTNPWNLCTIQQVEEFKALLKVLPIWSTGIMIAVTLSQHAFPVLQANTMDRHISKGSNFQIPASSYSAFGILTLTTWLVFYDRVLVPWISRFTRKPRGCGRTSGKRETFASPRPGARDHPFLQVDMSAMWLVPQHCLTGLAEAFNAIGQIEFYYSQFPKSMASVGVALFSLGMGFGNLVGSLIVEIVDHVTSKGGKFSWVSNNLNLGHYDYYYWVLCLLSVGNFFYFIVCAWAYGSDEDKRIWEEDQVEKKGEIVML
ncbi:protein NRT1/ PTR FAMILY 1.2-like [Solanum pennellii]|uniref:Protein NRT1/ PTR FAMILY 1.2-like n=1 Tax=Solanum pennellii TaxID=28526 RepID=A0ABM1V0S8_SOLPN|nr:protein NRT1/ PTR FAMILY 1.2-like [Solanum pennellii]